MKNYNSLFFYENFIFKYYSIKSTFFMIFSFVKFNLILAANKNDSLKKN